MLTHIVFDLDETLYPRQAGLMQEIGLRIMRYMIERLGLPLEEAQARRARYYRVYGTALRGLMTEETIDPEDYLRFVHDIDLTGFIEPNPTLAAMLLDIPLSKAIFTNATAEHARRVLEVLGVADLFALIFDIRAMRYINKPDPRAYRLLRAALDVPAQSCILVEDNPRNLLPAKSLGMATILVDHAECDQVDACVADILGVGKIVARMLNSPGSA